MKLCKYIYKNIKIIENFTTQKKQLMYLCIFSLLFLYMYVYVHVLYTFGIITHMQFYFLLSLTLYHMYFIISLNEHAVV